MTVYTVRFCDKEFVATNIKDFARIAVFAKWYLRSQDLTGAMQCSMQQQELQPSMPQLSLNEQLDRKKSTYTRRSSPSAMRKALRTLFYNVFF